MESHCKGIIFDKDGTLFDFVATWAGRMAGLLVGLAEGDRAREADLARVTRFDLAAGRFEPDSPLIASTSDQIAALLLPHLQGGSFATREAIRARMREMAEGTQPVPPVPLRPLLEGLRARGLPLAVVTNDSEQGALLGLSRAGVIDLFDVVIGFDSGHGAKPAPGQLLAAARIMGCDPAEVAMVGDTLHDLHAAEAAGMLRVGVLTGVAPETELAPHADVVLPDIGDLPAWLDRLG